MNPADMLKLCKEEYDRLIEIFPLVPKHIIKNFNSKFIDDNTIAKPEICDIITPTNIYNITKEERLEMAKLYNPPKLEPITETTEENAEPSIPRGRSNDREI